MVSIRGKTQKGKKAGGMGGEFNFIAPEMVDLKEGTRSGGAGAAEARRLGE